jgi:acetyl-CoA acetyltransferase
VLCLAAYRNTPSGTVGGRGHVYFDESLRDGGGPHAETPYAGLSAPVAGAALAARRYFHKYEVDPDKLSAVPLAIRGHAQRNPGAAIRKPLSESDYQRAPFIVEPLRLLDCSVVVDGAVALILTRDDRAADTPNTPVRILGMQGLGAGPNAYIFGQPGMGINDASLFDYQAPGAEDRVYRMAGVTPADVDFLQIYDAFSPLVLLTLERFGFCGAGEAADWVQGGRIAPGGDLPINSSGGMLSEGHLNGWNQFFETVTQIRQQAGDRQLSNAEIGQWGTALGDSIIFGRSR